MISHIARRIMVPLMGMFLLSLGPNLSMALGGEIQVAVAANFLKVFHAIAKKYENETGHTVHVSPGSSGKLYVQIKNDAPFDLFFSADASRPELLEKEGFAISGSRFTYAIGRLTLWSPEPLFVEDDGKVVLTRQAFEYLAIANPQTAPYGQAAVQVLKALHLWEALRDRLVYGENIGQTFQFVFTRNAQLGFVALSQALDPKFKHMGSRWDVPIGLYDPLTQQAVLLKNGKDKPVARDFLMYMKGKIARKIIEQYGYGIE